MGNQATERDLDNAIAYFEEKAGSLRRPSGKFLRRQEIRLREKLYRRFRRQKGWLLKRIEGLSYFKTQKGVIGIQRKDALGDFEGIMREMPEFDGIADDIGDTANGSYKKGARDIHKKLKMAESGLSFDLVNVDAVSYVRKLKTLHLSNFRGSISRETKKRIIKLLLDAVEEGKTYAETAKQIEQQGEEGVFSRARGELIAVNQVGRAYGTGNDTMIEKYEKETGAKIEKFWQTVDDDRVTPECETNQDMGWIQNDELFESGDSFAPRLSNPRCRCATSYRRAKNDE